MAEKTIEEMKADLSKEGYRGEWLYAGNGQAYTFTFGNGLEVSDWDKDSAIEKAYAHLQAQRELVALRAFVKEVADHKDYEPRKLFPYNIEAQTAHECTMLYEHVVKARDLVKQFNHADGSQ